MMCSTFSTSTANCITDRQFMSECSTRLEIFRCTNTSPGSMPRIWLAGTRESEQPIHRYFGVCCLDRRVKNPGSCARIDCDQRRLLSSSSCGDGISYSFVIFSSVGPRYANVLGFGEKPQRINATFAAHAGMLDAAERRAQVAHHPAVYPHDAEVDAFRDAVRACKVARPQRCREPIVRAVGDRDRFVFIVERDQRHHRTEDFLAIGGAILRQSFDHRRCYEPAIRAASGQLHRFAAGQYFPAFLSRTRDARRHLVEMRLR